MSGTTALLQEQARALGDPTRHRIFRYVADADAEVDVAELTAHFGFNHNAIRQHLAKLVRAGLVVESRAPAGGRGRPRLLYRVDPAVDSRWGATGPYERLSLLLAEVTRTGAAPVDVGRRSALRSVEAGRVGDREDEPVAALVDAMEREGFAPEVRVRGNRVEVVLRHCPFESAAMVDPDTVCALHLGIVEGVAEATGGRIVIDDLRARDPRRAGCRLVAHVEPRPRGS
ncbi:MAG: MarR family transcriptional regulator [Acidimicrobiia bacterium]